MGRIDWSCWAPPSQNAREEVHAFAWGLGGGAGLAWVWFLAAYWNFRYNLYHLKNGVRVLKEGNVMPDLIDVMGGCFVGLWILIGMAAVTIVRHYAAHYREGSRPVYLMRRLPDRWEYHRRCLAIPGAAAAAAAAVMLVSLAAFYGIYMTCTPAECIAPDQWAKIWRVL